MTRRNQLREAFRDNRLQRVQQELILRPEIMVDKGRVDAGCGRDGADCGPVVAPLVRKLELKVCVIAHIRDGTMDRVREYWDSASMARQLGMDSAALAAMYSSFESGAG